ncbi:TonB-dependent siderophore receptor [Advenella sp. S44]|uniref:TonB-dependent receptor n=1 Tax=Advenella sp. S44 TaxID=1982755 RepID=UPI000C29B019|nr:TonB-dependent siderophore receptor [Advenella sp. S44]MCK9509607.1 TonB-dependent siderophore receptor [Pigmentiphaga sp.]PJX24112.1 TonB-dependent siderophore receptor [Advenella sp. S44]
MYTPHDHYHIENPLRRTTDQLPTFTLNRTAAAVRMALLLGLAFGALVGVTPSTLAQTPSGANGAHASADVTENVTTLQAVKVEGSTESASTPYAGGQVTTGGRVGLLGDKDFMETPFNTISYTEKFMADQQASDIQEVIAKTDPTVFMSGISGESNESYSIRGFRSDVGDVTLNGLAGMAGYYRNLPEMFERVEVLKGPSALLNGMPPKGSAGGAINLVSKRAGEEPLTRLTTSYMSDSHFGGHIDMGRRFGENKQFGIRFNGVYRDGETSVKKQDKRISLASLGLDWRGERMRVSADLYQSKDRTEGMTRGLTLAPGLPLPKPPKKPDVSWNPPWAFYDTTDKGAMLRGEFDLTDQLTAYAAAGISKTEFDSNMGAPQVFNQAGDFRTNFSGVSDEMKRKSAEVGLMGKVRTGSVGHQFAINATHYSEDYHLRGFRGLLSEDWISNIYNPVWGPEPALPSDIPAISKTETRLTSFGLADTLSFAEDRVQLTLGVRRQQVINESFNGMTGARMGERYKESATTPAVALLVKVTDQISVYANYIEGLSQGSIAPNTAANAGEVFAPYKTKQKEVGLKFDLGEFAHTVSLYEIKRPSSYTDPFTNVFSFGGEQRNRGVEWGFFGSPLQGVRLMGGIAYSDPQVTKAASPANQGKQATGLPKWQAKMGVEWDTPALQGLTLTANATTASKQYLSADNSLSVPGRTVFDVGARYATKVAGNPVTLRAAVTNVTNKAYWAKPHFTSLALGAPRTFMLSASMDF